MAYFWKERRRHKNLKTCSIIAFEKENCKNLMQGFILKISSKMYSLIEIALSNDIMAQKNNSKAVSLLLGMD